MSAYQCTHCHVSAIAGRLSEVEYERWSERRTAELYTELCAANARSVAYRYPHNPEPQYEPEPCWKCATHHFTPLEIFKAVQCYQHQACEPPSWEASPLAKRLEQLRNEALGQHFGQDREYNACAWGIRPAHVGGTI